MKVIVTGARGMLAHALLPVLETAGHESLGLARGDADVSLPGALDHALELFKPDWIFHLAAWTKVDDCEGDPDRCASPAAPPEASGPSSAWASGTSARTPTNGEM